MAGRHRKPPAWRRTLTSMLRTRNRVRTAALRAEILALRATVASLRAELDALHESAARAVAQPVAAPPAAPALTLDLPLVRLALDDVAVDRGPDTAVTEIVLSTSPITATGQAVAITELPEGDLLDPRSDRDAEPRDPATAPATLVAVTSSTDRRTA